MDIEIPRELWEELASEFDVREDYSGRAMYGAICPGIVGDVQTLMHFTIYVAAWNNDGSWNEPSGEDLVNALASVVRSDNMGLDMIWYFPGVTIGSAQIDAARVSAWAAPR